MHNTIRVISAFIIALISTFFMMNGQLARLAKAFFMNTDVIIVLVIIIAIIFFKHIVQLMKNINRYSWLILGCYLSGTLAMEYQTYNFLITNSQRHIHDPSFGDCVNLLVPEKQ